MSKKLFHKEIIIESEYIPNNDLFFNLTPKSQEYTMGIEEITMSKKEEKFKIVSKVYYCPKHKQVEGTIHFDFPDQDIDERYCSLCLLDLLRSKLQPLKEWKWKNE